MVKPTTVRPPDIVGRAKHKAADESGASGRAPQQKARRPRVSKAAGGLKPAINISDAAALQELEDLDYAVRLK